MKVKVSEADREVLDWLVAKASGWYGIPRVPAYSTDWAQGGPIIDREEIRLTPPLAGETDWLAACGNPDFAGSTPLVAAMRCYVASRLGDEVEIPDNLS